MLIMRMNLKSIVTSMVVTWRVVQKLEEIFLGI